MDWSKLTLKVFAADNTNSVTAKVYLPEGDDLQTITIPKKGADIEVAPNTLSKTILKLEWIK